MTIARRGKNFALHNTHSGKWSQSQRGFLTFSINFFRETFWASKKPKRDDEVLHFFSSTQFPSEKVSLQFPTVNQPNNHIKTPYQHF